MANYTITTDAYVYQNAATTDYSGSTTLKIGFRPTLTREYQSYFYSDISAETESTTEAKLWIYVDSFSEWTTKNVYARRLTSSFSNSATWNTRPSNTASNQDTLSIANTDTGWISFDVTDIVNDIIGGETNYGIGLLDSGTGSSLNNEQMIIQSLENVSGNDPYIEVTKAASDTGFFNII